MINSEETSSKYAELIGEKVSQDQQISDWQKDLSRLIRRDEIWKQLGSNLPLEEIKAVVRQHESNLGISKLVDGLVSKEFVISPKVAALAEELRGKLLGFEFLDCVVLQGSAVHGGGTIRNVTSGSYSHDLDWGIIFKGDGPEEDELKKMVTKANRVIPKLAIKHGLGADFRSCGGVNPMKCFMPKLRDLEHAKFMWKHFNGGSASVKDLMLYFQPSFPANSNIENRKLLLEALSALSGDTVFFDRVINSFLHDWGDWAHKIQDKHFGDSVTKPPRGTSLKKRVVKNSNFVMSKAMESLLRATASGSIFYEPTAYSPSLEI